MPQHPEPRPRDDRDATKDIARDLAEIATHMGQLKGEANAYLSDPNYDRLKLRLENALPALSSAARMPSSIASRTTRDQNAALLDRRP
jgi:hypothetical protein